MNSRSFVTLKRMACEAAISAVLADDDATFIEFASESRAYAQQAYGAADNEFERILAESTLEAAIRLRREKRRQIESKPPPEGPHHDAVYLLPGAP